MNLTNNQFEVLTYIEKNKDNKITQREIGIETSLALGTINKIIGELMTNNLIKNDDELGVKITNEGLTVLEPYKVKRAIFLAAGFGSRLVPITLNTPKPLIMVHGKKIIETLLDAVIAAGIEEIIIVRGYLLDQFDILLKKYPMIKFVDNLLYNEANNISSTYLVRDKMENAYVFESDLYLYNSNLIRKYEFSSNYLGMYMDKTDDWCFEERNGYISKLQVGGFKCYHMFGIAYLDKKAGQLFKTDVEKVYIMPGGKEKFWDQVHLEVFKNNYKFMIRDCKINDIVEIDTFNELKEIDSIYNV
ncbi:MAG: sugar phosphate nucleotidyltransferase [Bacilli bacterium]